MSSQDALGKEDDVLLNISNLKQSNLNDEENTDDISWNVLQSKSDQSVEKVRSVCQKEGVRYTAPLWSAVEAKLVVRSRGSSCFSWRRSYPD